MTFLSRRHALSALATLTLSSLSMPSSFAQEKPFFAQAKPFFPHEGGLHARSFMTLCHADFLYGLSWQQAIQKEQALIANTLVDFEPVSVIIDDSQKEQAKTLFRDEIDFIFLPHFDIWARDTLPLFSVNSGSYQALITNFNVWGEKFRGYKDYDRDRELALRLAKDLDVSHLDVSHGFAPFVFEGGAVDLDGDGTLLTTRSCLLHPNRNPGNLNSGNLNSGISEKDMTSHLTRTLGVDRVIWIDGSPHETVTDGHVDGIARFVKPGLVVAEYTDTFTDPEYQDLKNNIRQLEKARDAEGRLLEVATLPRPRTTKTRVSSADFAASYVNHYTANGIMLLSEFGDDTRDQGAYDLFSSLYPSRKIVSVNVDNICKGGGGIHCVLQSLPAIV